MYGQKLARNGGNVQNTSEFDDGGVDQIATRIDTEAIPIASTATDEPIIVPVHGKGEYSLKTDRVGYIGLVQPESMRHACRSVAVDQEEVSQKERCSLPYLHLLHEWSRPREQELQYRICAYHYHCNCPVPDAGTS